MKDWDWFHASVHAFLFAVLSHIHLQYCFNEETLFLLQTVPGFFISRLSFFCRLSLGRTSWPLPGIYIRVPVWGRRHVVPVCLCLWHCLSDQVSALLSVCFVCLFCLIFACLCSFCLFLLSLFCLIVLSLCFVCLLFGCFVCVFVFCLFSSYMFSFVCLFLLVVQNFTRIIPSWPDLNTILGPACICLAICRFFYLAVITYIHV